MTPRRALIVTGVLVWAAGCADEEPVPPPEPKNAPSNRIVAVRPEPMMQRVSRRPAFKWKLPKRLERATLVSFLLAEAGTGDEPVTDEARERRIATVTGLDESSPEAMNLWDPPAGCVLTGEVRDMSQLAPETWYRWRVRAVAAGTGDHADFYFRTRDTPAVPGE
ncbi:MAG: hypothetical protein R6X20_05105 [Phycisphaerae bacterium]